MGIEVSVGHRYYLKDHLGSTRLVTDQNDGVIATFDYYPFGLLMPKRYTTNSSTIEKFTSKELDSSLNLHYFGARYYDAALARWQIVDPLLNEMTPNKLLEKDVRYLSQSPYNYVHNNPLRYVDPDGKQIDAVADAGFILYDLYDIGKSIYEGEGVSGTQWATLGLDAVGLVVPFATGLGKAYKAGKLAKGLSQSAKIDNVGNFASGKLLNKHFADHGADFSGKFSSAKQYARGARNFFKRESKNIISYTRKGGDIVRYDTKNNIFGIISKEGTIRTFFKPKDKLKYFKKNLKQDLGKEVLKYFK